MGVTVGASVSARRQSGASGSVRGHERLGTAFAYHSHPAPRAGCQNAFIPTMPTSEQLRLPSLVRVRVVPPATAGWRELDRVSWLTPYEAETIGEDARRAGPGTRLEVTVPRPADDARLAAVRSLFGWLAAKGIDVVVREGDAEQL